LLFLLKIPTATPPRSIHAWTRTRAEGGAVSS
jgi:hypothetical protein